MAELTWFEKREKRHKRKSVGFSYFLLKIHMLSKLSNNKKAFQYHILGYRHLENAKLS